MKTPPLNRRTFLVASCGFTALAATSPKLPAAYSAADPKDFIVAFDDAWARHDAHALTTLHAEDVVVVNRYGSMLEGRAELEKALHFLHDPGGPFHTLTFPRQKILTTRSLEPNTFAVHTKWRNPPMQAGDQLKNGGVDTPWVDMIATYLLVYVSHRWQIIQHDLHNVDPIQFPFATKWNH